MDVLERAAKRDKVIEGFLKSKYNNIAFDGSDLEQQIFMYRHAKKVYLSPLNFEDAVDDITKEILRIYQRQLNYRFD